MKLELTRKLYTLCLSLLQKSFLVTGVANEDINDAGGSPAVSPCTPFAIYTLLHYPARKISNHLPLVGELDTT